MEFERSTTVGVDADKAFAFLSDPVRLPEYVGTMTLIESTAIDGAPGAEVEPADPVEQGARFFADRNTRRLEWGRPDGDYEGSIVVAPGTRSTSQVTIRLRTRADADAAAIERMLEDTLRLLRRHLSGR
jgi:hypothetical protein